MWPTPVEVDVATVSRGPLVVTVDEEGRTRVRDRFVVSAPVAGRVLRIELEPGDRVRRGDVIARVQAEVPPLLDARTRAEAVAVVESARAGLGRARAEHQRAAAALAQAQRELERARRLTTGGVLSTQELEAREVEARLAAEAVNAAAFAVSTASAEVQRTEARLRPAVARAGNGAVAVTAPADSCGVCAKAKASCRQGSRSSRSAILLALKLSRICSQRTLRGFGKDHARWWIR